MSITVTVIFIITALLAGVALGFFISQKMFKKHLRENPPITEEVVIAMMSQMGRKPSQKQVNQVMKQVRANLE